MVTRDSLLLVMGGVLAGLKPHQQHVERLRFDEIESIEIIPQSFGCLNFVGIPPADLIISPKDKSAHAEKWSALAVDYKVLGEVVKIACHVHEQIGRRKTST